MHEEMWNSAVILVTQEQRNPFEDRETRVLRERFQFNLASWIKKKRTFIDTFYWIRACLCCYNSNHIINDYLLFELKFGWGDQCELLHYSDVFLSFTVRTTVPTQ